MTEHSDTKINDTAVERHWFSGKAGDLLTRIDNALKKAGKSLSHLTAEDLLAFDEFHIRGREATVELSGLAKIQAFHEVIDIGSGLGGPSRFIASSIGCNVTGIDLTAEYCQVARVLADRTGLEDRVHYRQGNALAVPFPDASFDIAWTQHISMNIQDKSAMFSEMYRVLKPGGRAAIYDPIAGSGEPLTFPVPWANDGTINFLIDTQETKETLTATGFTIETWQDVSQASLAWFKVNARPADAEPPILGLHLLLGPLWPTMAANMVSNIAAGRLAVIQAIVRKPQSL